MNANAEAIGATKQFRANVLVKSRRVVKTDIVPMNQQRYMLLTLLLVRRKLLKFIRCGGEKLRESILAGDLLLITNVVEGTRIANPIS
jgi:hypothetical protein